MNLYQILKYLDADPTYGLSIKILQHLGLGAKGINNVYLLEFIDIAKRQGYINPEQ